MRGDISQTFLPHCPLAPGHEGSAVLTKLKLTVSLAFYVVPCFHNSFVFLSKYETSFYICAIITDTGVPKRCIYSNFVNEIDILINKPLYTSALANLVWVFEMTTVNFVAQLTAVSS